MCCYRVMTRMFCWGALLTECALAGPVPTSTKPAHYPDWWFERDVIVRKPSEINNLDPQWPLHYNAPDDFGVANIGQLKLIASKAAEEMETLLPAPGAGSAIHSLLAGWDPGLGGVDRDDYAVLNQGQLKYVAKLFYDRLADFGYSGPPLFGGALYPWTHGSAPEATADDDSYAAVNLGQLKHVFSFVPAAAVPLDDSDGDGLPDDWEVQHFGSISAETGASNRDGDSLSNLAEFLVGSNPNSSDDTTSPVSFNLLVTSP
jgi:hypothetical protein